MPETFGQARGNVETQGVMRNEGGRRVGGGILPATAALGGGDRYWRGGRAAGRWDQSSAKPDSSTGTGAHWNVSPDISTLSMNHPVLPPEQQLSSV